MLSKQNLTGFLGPPATCMGPEIAHRIAPDQVTFTTAIELVGACAGSTSAIEEQQTCCLGSAALPPAASESCPISQA